MTEKEAFISIVQEIIFDNSLVYSKSCSDTFDLAEKYFNKLKEEKKSSNKLTENGIKILKFMQENYEKCNNVFKAKEIAEGLFTSSRSVSGSMKKLINEGFVEKIGSDPVSYAITENGKEKELK